MALLKLREKHRISEEGHNAETIPEDSTSATGLGDSGEMEDGELGGTRSIHDQRGETDQGSGQAASTQIAGCAHGRAAESPARRGAGSGEEGPRDWLRHDMPERSL